MKFPRLAGVVERRLLVNYRVDPDVLAAVLPSPFRPQVVGDWGVAGICLIRMGSVRPRHLPARLGVRSENAAHRISVEWDTDDGVARGVYIPRRDTDALLNAVVGGRLFPGEQHRARFDVHEDDDDLRVSFASADGTTSVSVHVRPVAELRGSTLFADLAEASAFFERGSVGYSARHEGDRFDGLALHTDAWAVEPVEVVQARSSVFDDATRFPPGSTVLDCALLMRQVPVQWRALPQLAAALS
jgi:hypothetical protein